MREGKKKTYPAKLHCVNYDETFKEKECRKQIECSKPYVIIEVETSLEDIISSQGMEG